MTTFNKRSEISKTRARMQAIAAAGREAAHDPWPAASFARSCLYGRSVESLAAPDAGDVGILTLALAGLALRSLRESTGSGGSARVTSQAQLNALLALFRLTMPLNVRKLNGALNEIIRLAPLYRGYVCAQEQAQLQRDGAGRAGEEGGAGRESSRQPEHGSQLFSRSLAGFQFGFDGHWMTRETAARLRLVRYFEKTSGEFSLFVRRAWTHLAHHGAASLAWQSGFPIFICDLNKAAHLEAAAVIHNMAHGEAVIVTPRVSQEIRRQHVPRTLLVVEDPVGAFAAIAGNYGSVMLLERRIGGWTVTFPAGRAPARELSKSTYGKLPLALARCAPENARAFERMQREKSGAGGAGDAPQAASRRRPPAAGEAH